MTSRDAFESWCETHSLELSKHANDYDNPVIEILWDTWKAATQRAADIAYDAVFCPLLRDNSYAESISRSINE